MWAWSAQYKNNKVDKIYIYMQNQEHNVILII